MNIHAMGCSQISIAHTPSSRLSLLKPEITKPAAQQSETANSSACRDLPLSLEMQMIPSTTLEYNQTLRSSFLSAALSIDCLPEMSATIGAISTVVDSSGMVLY